MDTQELSKIQKFEYERGIKPFASVIRADNVIEFSINNEKDLFVETLQDGYLPTKAYNKATNKKLPTSIKQNDIIKLAKTLAEINAQTFGEKDKFLSVVLPDKPLRFTFIKAANKTIASSIRRLSTTSLPLTSFGLDEKTIQQITTDIKQYKNIAIAGATGSGKTSLMNSFLQLIDKQDRIITIQDVEELIVPVNNKVSFLIQSNVRTSTIATELDDAMNAVCRLNPTRVILGELNSNNAFPMLKALSTGHSGSMFTMHSNSTDTTLDTIALNVSMGSNMNKDTAEQLATKAINIIYHLKRVRGEFKLSRLET